MHRSFSHLRKTKYLSPDENIVPDQEFLGIYWYNFSMTSSGSKFRLDPEVFRAPHGLPDQNIRITEVGCHKNRENKKNSHCRHPYEEPSSRSQFIQPNYHFDGTMQHNGTQSFTQLLLQQLNGNWPGMFKFLGPFKTCVIPLNYLIGKK